MLKSGAPFSDLWCLHVCTQFVKASGVLVNAKRAMGCRAGTLCDVYFLIVGALLEGDLNIQFLRCSEPSLAFGIEDPAEKIVEAFGSFELSTRGMQ